jgi:hypothetical protein
MPQKLEYLPGNSRDQDILRTVKIDEKFLDTTRKGQWKSDDKLAIDTIDGGPMEIECVL